ncbi:hypothetical protein ACFL59_00080 [Planctomycetota bacterium]
MRRFLERWKPAAPATMHVLMAAVLWTCVGSGLAGAGVWWTLGLPGVWAALLLALSLLAGLMKGRFILEPKARRTVARIVARGDGRCLGGFLSGQTWLLVLAMMGLGVVLRRTDLPRIALGVVYGTVGVALLLGSRLFWVEWWRLR